LEFKPINMQNLSVSEIKDRNNAPALTLILIPKAFAPLRAAVLRLRKPIIHPASGLGGKNNKYIIHYEKKHYATGSHAILAVDDMPHAHVAKASKHYKHAAPSWRR
jgi:hypothetical protein